MIQLNAIQDYNFFVEEVIGKAPARLITMTTSTKDTAPLAGEQVVAYSDFEI